MLFQSAQFLFVFLPLMLIAYYGAFRFFGVNAAVIVMVVGSLIFYGQHHYPDLAVLLVSITFNFVLGERIKRTRSAVALAFGIVVNLLTLAWFKYAGMLFDTVVPGLSSALLPDIVLPLAVSFFTFQQIAYLCDIQSGKSPKYSFIKYTYFVTFFPHLIAGPILHHAQILPQAAQLSLGRRRVLIDLAVGSALLCIGLAKKTGIADGIAPFADRVFLEAGPGVAPPMIDCWIGAFAYALQIYFDFSGYSDMALGLGRMFGIRLPMNFYSPYRATSIIEFWRRWHMTLSRFLRDYLYVPLGGNRHGTTRRYANLMIVMLLGGLWHGADWAFMLWGGLHGSYLIINHFWRHLWGERSGGLPGRLTGWGLTMMAVVWAWVPFRAADIDTTLSMYRAMAGLDGLRLGESKILVLGQGMRLLHNIGLDLTSANVALTAQAWLVVGTAVALLAPNAYQVLAAYRPALTAFPEGPRGLRWRLAWPLGAVLAMAAALAFFSQSRSIEFLYFQF